MSGTTLKKKTYNPAVNAHVGMKVITYSRLFDLKITPKETWDHLLNRLLDANKMLMEAERDAAEMSGEFV
jgi:hypothetical protein